MLVDNATRLCLREIHRVNIPFVFSISKHDAIIIKYIVLNRRCINAFYPTVFTQYTYYIGICRPPALVRASEYRCRDFEIIIFGEFRSVLVLPHQKAFVWHREESERYLSNKINLLINKYV